MKQRDVLPTAYPQPLPGMVCVCILGGLQNFAHDGANYTNKMKWIYNMQNLTFGADGALKPACQSKFPADPHYCFMS
jgi:hypothetical protein